MPMRVILFGGTGMVGQGVLKECERDADVTEVLAVGRSPLENADAKVWEIAAGDLFDLDDDEDELTGFDACFFCLGVSSAGMSEEAYTKVTYDLTMSVAKRLVRLNPGMVFEYVSGAGTDTSEKGRVMWARVKGKTENDLLELGFKGAYMFRPGGIVPMDGIRSKTKAYQMLYSLLGPVMPLLKRMFPQYVTTTRELGRAMVRVAKVGYEKKVIEAGDIAGIGSE
jgi:uncharacterized protein YbjT (DUF2867 family)